jgi:hypothetical protein
MDSMITTTRTTMSGLIAFKPVPMRRLFREATTSFSLLHIIENTTWMYTRQVIRDR